MDSAKTESIFFTTELMEYTPYSKIKYYSDCAPLVEGLGYKLVDLKIIPAKNVTKISAIITGKDPAQNIGVNDCAKVHRALLTRLEALLGTEETTMELTSPGIEHNLKNAAEFSVFTGREVRVWDKAADDKKVVLESEGSQKEIAFENIAKAKFTYNK